VTPPPATQPAPATSPSSEAEDFEEIRQAALAGLRLSMSVAMAAIDRRDEVPKREARLADLRRLYKVAEHWQPLGGELPKRTR